MRKGRKLLICLVAASPLIAGLVILFHDEEPTYQGQPLSTWVMKSGAEEGQMERAIQAIGPRANPYLLRWIGSVRDRWPRYRSLIAEFSPGIHRRIFENPDTEFRKSVGAIRAFGALGPQAKDAIPQLAEMVKSEKSQVRASHAAHALALIGDLGRPPLIAALTNQTPRVRLVAAGVFWLLGTNAGPAVPHLMKALKDSDSNVVCAAFRSLATLQPEDTNMVAILIGGLHHPEAQCRQFAARNLPDYGRQARSAVPSLTECLQDPDPEVRRLAKAALRDLEMQQ